MNLVHYRTIDIAREVGIHVNTVRLYEQIGLISAAPRADNGYRIFSKKHLYQTKIARLIFHGMWPGKAIRRSGMKIVSAMKEWDLNAAHKYAHEYIKTIEEEREKAFAAVKTLDNWRNGLYTSPIGNNYNRKQAATIIGTSPEALRNWERRGLIKIRQESGKRVYSVSEIERLRVIYVMLQSNYKIEEISGKLQLYDKETIKEIHDESNQMRAESISNLHSHWLEVSDNALENAMKVFKLLDEIYQTLQL